MTIPSSSAVPQPLAFSRREWHALFIAGEYEKLCVEFVRCLEQIAKTSYWNLSAETRAQINDFVENFLFFFCHDDFTIPGNYPQRFIGFHPLITNIVAISDFKTTTPWVVRLARKKGNFYKLLALYNIRTEIDINPALFFDVNDFFASEWWTYFWIAAPAFCLRETHEKIRRHLEALDPRFIAFGQNARASYFPVTYVAPEKEPIIKQRLNGLIQQAFSNVKIRNRPSPKKIVVITDRWHRSAVYTSLAPLVKSLAGHYEISLIHFGRDESTIMDREMFHRYYCVRMERHEMDLNVLQDNEWSAAIYPDIGMNAESIYLSNIRIAPVQLMMYGHPVSTWGSQVDYFIGGRKVEDLSQAAVNYGERLVVIPGMGVYPVYPDDFVPPGSKPSFDRLIVNCGWTAQKVTWPLLNALQEILGYANKPVVFRIFPGNAVAHHNGFIPFVKDIHSLLGPENVQVLPLLSRLDYLRELWSGDIALDSYPFGGFNSVIDPLWLKKPTVVWQTGRAYSRFASSTLEIIGMPELIARDREEYVDKTVRLINDDGFRREMTEKIAGIDLKAAFAKQENPEYFLKAVDYLIENHECLSAENSRKPIVIE
jgi:hypothetical protein